MMSLSTLATFFTPPARFAASTLAFCPFVCARVSGAAGAKLSGTSPAKDVYGSANESRSAHGRPSRSMFLLKSLMPAPLLTSPRTANAYLARACDAAVSEPARVAALRALHGVPFDHALRNLASALVALLNEPLWWLPSEALSLLSFARPLVHLGVVNGRFVLSPSKPFDIVSDDVHRLYCASIGRVTLPRDVRQLDEHAPCLPWLHGSRGDL